MRRALPVCALLVLAACHEGRPGPAPATANRSALLDGDAPTLHRGFRGWLDRYLSVDQSRRAGLEAEGEALAEARHAGLRELLVSDPRLALELALTPAERAALPEAIAAHVETWRDGIGTLHVVAGVADRGEAAPPVERFVTFVGDETTLRAGVFGARLDGLTRVGVRLHGVALDDAIALTEKRLRRLWPGEVRPDLPAEWPRACPVSKKSIDAEEVYHGGDTLYGFCLPLHAEAFDGTLADGEVAFAAAEGLPPASAWTEGAKTVLYIRVDYDDQPGDPLSATAAQNAIDTDSDTFFQANSYGKTSLSAVVTPTLRLPRTRGAYRDAGDYLRLRSDALAAARDAGYEPSAYSNDIVAFASTFSGWAGRGYVGSRGTWLNGSFNLRTTAHELGHNYGAYHANAWNTSGLSPIGPGSTIEYGNPFDIMGGGGGQTNHFNAWNKRRFDWLAPALYSTVTSSGTYRVQALEPSVSSGLQALRVPRDAQRDYWVEFRPAINNAALRDGVSLLWGFPSNTQSQLLDMTPGDGDRSNSPLLIGRTFSDPFADLHVTPVAKPGTTPASIDVVVNVGPFPGNRAPTLSLTASATAVAANQAVTFTATASDPDGDALAYAWDFDDGTWGPNLPTATKGYAAPRHYRVRLTVSDMKGLTASAAVLITVGTPSTFLLSGTVTAGAQPLADVRVTDGTRRTLSASDGTWALTNVPAGSVTVNATKLDYTFARGFAAPLTVGADQAGLDFTGAPSPGYTLSGRVTAAGLGVAGVLVSDGSRAATTNGNGDYSLTGVPSGRVGLTASLPGYGFVPSGFVNPVEVFGANVASLNFMAAGQLVSGSIPSGSVATAPVVTDGVRTVTAVKNRPTDPWTFALQSVPNGTWNLVATSPGVTLTPGNFTNPVTVSGSARTGLTFQVVSTPGFLVQGTVKTGGTPLPGVAVSDGTRSATTDSLGRYTLVGVPAGVFTLTPTLTGYTFVPASRSVTVATADLTGQDFGTTVVNLPPTVVAAVAATPAPVTAGTTTALSVLGADDAGEGQLTYTWAATGAWPVGFSATGTNGAKSATATFSGAGTYTIECIITDAGGLSVRSATTVSVQQVLSSLDLTPATANVMTGATQLFQATGRDQFARAMFAGGIAWSASGGGTVSGTGTSGTFVAGATPGGPHTLTAVAGARSATALVSVTGTGAPVLTAAASATPNPVSGTVTRLAVRASDDLGEPNLVYRWSMTQGPAPVAFSANDTNGAKDSDVTFAMAGDYDFVVGVVDGAGNVVTSAVSVSVLATPTRVDVQPAVVSLVAGQTQQFTATAFDQFDAPVLPAPAFTWGVSGGGAVDGSGLFTAGGAAGGPYLLSASAGGSTASSQLVITWEPDLEAPAVTLTAPAGGARVETATTVMAEATDNVGVVKVAFFVDDSTPLGEAVAAPWEAVLDPATLADGAHVLTARAYDAAGNESTSAPVTIGVGDGPVDLTPPQVHVLTPAPSTETALLVRATVEATDDVGVASVDLELDGATVATLTAPPWRRELDVTAGAHALVAVARDAAGNVGRSEAVPFLAREELPAPPPEALERVLGGCGCAGVDGGALGLLVIATLRRRRR